MITTSRTLSTVSQHKNSIRIATDSSSLLKNPRFHCAYAIHLHCLLLQTILRLVQTRNYFGTPPQPRQQLNMAAARSLTVSLLTTFRFPLLSPEPLPSCDRLAEQ